MHFPIALTALALAALSKASPLNSMATVNECSGGIMKNDTILHGNGNPHQNFIFVQISNTIDCDNNPSGSVSVTNSTSIGWSASIGFSTDFVSLGFSVDSSTSTGQTEAAGCKTDNGTHPGGLCLMERIQTTSYTGKHHIYDTRCGPRKRDDDKALGIITAPNNIQGGCYYNNFQLGLKCDVMGTKHYFNVGIPGGPDDPQSDIQCNPWMPPGLSQTQSYQV